MAKEPGHESFQRMNYLYQAAEETVRSGVVGLDRQLLRSMWGVSKKTVKKLDPTIKRTVCKGCGGLLQPGTTARVRIRSKRQKHVTWTCLTCGAFRRFLLNPKHTLWYDKPEAQVKPGEKSKDAQRRQVSSKSKAGDGETGKNAVAREQKIGTVGDVPDRCVEHTGTVKEGDMIEQDDSSANTPEVPFEDVENQ